MSNHPMRVFSTAFKEGVVRRLESGEALATVSKDWGSRASFCTSGAGPGGAKAQPG